MKGLLLALYFIIYSLCAAGQTDTEFWFAAPEVSQTAPSDLDRPILLRITAYTSPAVVTVSQPAGIVMPPQTISVGANNTVTINLTAWLDSIECKPADRVLDRGLKITATSPVTVYYEVAAPDNPEAFILKGRTALGRDFWIPSQNFVQNNIGTLPPARSAFDIVATENNTLVTITPANAIVGHAAGSTFSVVLNTGQTYSATALGNAASDHLQGSRVVSDKPIAITVKDDLLNEASLYLGTCGDLGGDQIVPAGIVGTEYIAMPGLLQGAGDQLFITATQNGTTISQNGGAVITTINAGDTYRLPVGGAATYIQTSHPAYVWQLSGIGCEMGLGLMPKINCTGSTSVSFVRSTARSLYLNLMVKNGGQGSFLINGMAGLILPAYFTAVPGTGGQWYTARISLSLASYPQGGVVSVINNASLFHLGVLEGGSSGGTTYGYFSDFGNIIANAGAGSTFVCPGSTIYLYGDTVTAAMYSWTGPNGFTSNLQNPEITNVSGAASGVYTVTVEVSGCSIDSDTVRVQVNEISVNLGGDTAVCRDSIRLQSSLPYTRPSFRWNTGDTTSSLNVTASGIYWLEVKDEGCIASDTIRVTLGSAQVNLGPDTFFCGDSLVLRPSSGYTSPAFLWNTGDITSSLKVTIPGTYWLMVDDAGCTGKDTIQVTLRSTSVNLGPDLIACGDSVLLRSSTTYLSPSYQWSTGVTAPQLQVTGTGGTYWLEVRDNGCTGTDTIKVVLRSTSVNLGPDTFFCGNTAVLRPLGIYTAPSYRWSTGAIAPQVTITASGIYWLEVMDNGCVGSDTIRMVSRSVQVNLGLDISVCSDSVTLGSSAVYFGPSYRWSTGAISAQLKVISSGTYWLQVTDNGCTKSDTIQIALFPPLHVDLGPNRSVCDTDLPFILHSSQPAGAGYTWSMGLTDSSIAVNNSGTYWLAVRLGACTASDTIQIRVVRTPDIFLGNDTVICEQMPLRLSAIVPGAGYLWSTGSTENHIEVSTTGIYRLEVNLDGCIANDEIQITGVPPPPVELGPGRDICPGQVLILDAGSIGVKYQWNTGDTTSAIAAGHAGLYHVAVTSSEQCVGYDSIYLEQRFLPVVYLGEDTAVCEETPFLLAASYTNADELTWSDGSHQSTLAIKKEGLYIISGANVCGIVSDSIIVRHIFCDIWVPNVFTPNGDGSNDVFKVLGNLGRLEGFSLSVFNRWGQRIFQTTDKYIGWDGRFNHGDAPLGTYVYMLEYSFEDKPYVQKGNFHLIR